MPIFLIIVIIALLFFVLALVIILLLEASEKKMMLGGLQTSLFLVLMPKNEPAKEGQREQEEKILISHMEQVLANFLHLRKQSVFGATPSVTLEIASQTGGQDISFYVCVPQNLETVFEKYVQGVYPKAMIEKVPQDYTVFEPQGYTTGAYLKLAEHYLLPISTYQKLEKDPISAITNSVSKIAANEGAAVQVIIRPLAGIDVRKKGEKALAKIREGKPAKAAVAQATQHSFFQMIEETSKSSTSNTQDINQKKEQGFDQAAHDAIQSKIQKQMFETNVRIVAS